MFLFSICCSTLIFSKQPETLNNSRTEILYKIWKWHTFSNIIWLNDMLAWNIKEHKVWPGWTQGLWTCRKDVNMPLTVKYITSEALQFADAQELESLYLSLKCPTGSSHRKISKVPVRTPHALQRLTPSPQNHPAHSNLSTAHQPPHPLPTPCGAGHKAVTLLSNTAIWSPLSVSLFSNDHIREKKWRAIAQPARRRRLDLLLQGTLQIYFLECMLNSTR